MADHVTGSPAPDPAPGHPDWAVLAAGSASGASVAAVVGACPAGLSGAELVDAIVASEKAMSAVAATQMGLLTEFARPGRAGDVGALVASLVDKGGAAHRPDGSIDVDVVDAMVTDRAQSLAAAEVAAALRISPITAGVRVRKAQELCVQLPGTVQALAAGRIDRGRALLIAERTAVLTGELRSAVEARVLPLAEQRSAGNLRPLLDRAVIAADPAAAEQRERKAKRERDLTMYSLPDGMAAVRAFAPAAAAVSIFTVADLLAGRTGVGDDRPVGARRVDVWADIAEELLTHGRVDLTGLLDDLDDTDETVPVDRSSAGPGASRDGQGTVTSHVTAGVDTVVHRAAATPDPAPAAPAASADVSVAAVDTAITVDTVSSDEPVISTATVITADPTMDNDPAIITGPPINTDASMSEVNTDAAIDADPAISTDTTSASMGDVPAMGGVPAISTGPAMGGVPAISTGPALGEGPAISTGPAFGAAMSEVPVISTGRALDDGIATMGGDAVPGPDDHRVAGVRAASSADVVPWPGWDHRLPRGSQQLVDARGCAGPDDCGGGHASTGNREQRRAQARWQTRQGRRSHLTVTMSASTWAGLDRLPAHLDGYGAITAETGLMLVTSAGTISAALLDPASGAVIDVGTRVYRPRQSVKDVATSRAETCRFPSCRQPSWRCELDHRDAFDHDRPDAGGGTTPDNLDPLCRAHHQMKHHCGWSSTPVDGLGREWISPTRHRYLDPARSLTLPDELLTPTPTPSTTSAAQQHRTDQRRPDPSEPPHQAVNQHRADDFVSAPRRGHPDFDPDPGSDRDFDPGSDPDFDPDPDSDRDPDRDRDPDFDSDPDPDSEMDVADRPDWREAEFGGAFPDTPTLKMIHTIARQRILPLRDRPHAAANTAERLAAIASLHQPDDPPPPADHHEATNPTESQPNTTELGDLPDEPPF